MSGRLNNEHWIRQAIGLAGAASDRGDEPFGALLVVDDAPILTARNAVNTQDDPTQHAELRLISKASRQFGSTLISASTLYTSTEPCAMCAGAIYWSGISHVVFGLAAASLEAMTGGGGLHQPVRDVLGSASRRILIEGPFLEEEARSVHECFW